MAQHDQHATARTAGALDLPVHPTQRHPLTGQPLRALWVRPDGRAMWPIMGGAPEGEAEASAAGQGASTGAGTAGAAGPGAGGQSAGQGGGQQDDEPTWDALRSAWEDSGLTPGQIKGRLDASRKWEQRAKGAPSAEELATLREKAEKHDALELELSSDLTKAVTEATKKAQGDADAKYQPLLAETAFRIAIGDRKTEDEVEEFIADLNLSRFLNDDGKVDTAKVLARVEQFAPATGNQQNQQQRRGPSPTGQGSSSGNQRSAPGTGTVSAGRDLYAETHPKKAS